MVKTLILIIIPEFKTCDDVISWEKNVEWAEDNFNKQLEQEKISIEQRWAIGFVAWKKLIKYLHSENNVSVYFIRCDFRISENYIINEDIISVKYDNNFGHIIYKTLISFNIFKNDYDFFVRTNANTLIDIYQLNIFLQTFSKEGIYTSPLWEGGNYSFGYFMLMSKDVINYLVTQKYDSRWFNQDTADDYEMTNVILSKFKHTYIVGCDLPWISTYHKKPLISFENKHSIRFDASATGESSTKIIEKIKKTPDSIFLYRIKIINDNKYFEVYKFLIRHMWNKVVKERYKDLVIYNEINYAVPHLEYERDEQLLVARYVEQNDKVLELGARYGSVSCIINKILSNKLHQVSVEPDSTVWEVLEKNKKINNCFFYIHKGIVSKKNYELKLNGYGSTIDLSNKLSNLQSITTDNISLEDLQNKYNITFNVLVADCEGFLELFLNENPFLYKQLNKIIFECDRGDICNYDLIKENLIKNNFILAENGFQCVYIKNI